MSKEMDNNKIGEETSKPQDQKDKSKDKDPKNGGLQFASSDDTLVLYGRLGKITGSTLEALPLTHLISEPLKACVQAQNESAKATLAYMEEIGLVTNEKTGHKAVIKVEFEFISEGKVTRMSVPLLTLVPLSFMSLKEVKVSFKAVVNSSANQSETLSESFLPSQANENERKEESPEKKSEPEQEKIADSDASQNQSTEEGEGKKNEDKKTDDFDWKSVLKAAPSYVEKAFKAYKASKGSDKKEGANYSNKKDSTATRESRYSIETTLDISLTAVPSDMPGGLAKMLEVLNHTVDVFDANGELYVSERDVRVGASVKVRYKNTQGLNDSKAVTVSPSSGYEQTTKDEEILLTFSIPKEYTISAGKKKEKIVVQPQ